MASKLHPVGRCVVNVFEVIGSGIVVAQAFEPSTYSGRHHTVSRLGAGDQVFGRMGTEGPTDEAIGARRGRARESFVDAWYRARKVEAITVIGCALAIAGESDVTVDVESGEVTMPVDVARRIGAL